MRLFALECLRWAEQADDQGQFDLMLQCARSWMSIASTAEQPANAAWDQCARTSDITEAAKPRLQ